MNKLVSIVSVVLNNREQMAVFLDRYSKLKRRSETQLVVVDGGSTDGTLSLLKQHEEIIDILISGPDSGIYDAMNKGIAAASGKYVILINSDDQVIPENFDEAVGQLVSATADIVAGAARMVENGKLRFIRWPRVLERNLFVRTIPFSHNAIFISMALYDRIGLYRTDLKIVSDLELYYRAFFAGVTVELIRKPIITSELTGISGRQSDVLESENVEILRNYLPFLSYEDAVTLTKFRTALVGQPHAVDLRRIRAIVDIATDFDVDMGGMIKSALDYHPTELVGDGFLELIEGLPRNPKLQNDYRPFQPIEVTPPEEEELITIGIAAYNCEETIQRTIESALNQTWQNTEIVIVDDSSVDGTIDKIREFQSEKIRLVQNNNNTGVASVRNQIAALARGRYVMFCDDDDVSLPNRAEACLRKIKEIEAATNAAYVVCFTTRTLVTMAGKELIVPAAGIDASLIGSNIEEVIYANLARVAGFAGSIGSLDIAQPRAVGAGVGMYPTRLLRLIGFHETFARLEDLEFCMAASAMATFTGIEEPLYKQYMTTSPDKSEDLTAFFSILLIRLYEDRFTSFEISAPMVAKNYVNMASAGWRARLSALAMQSDMLDYVTDNVSNREAGDFSPTERNQISRQKLSNRSNRLLNVVTFVLWDYGGAGQGSQRRVEALRRNGVDAEIYCVFKNTNKPHVRQAPLIHTLGIPEGDAAALTAVWRTNAVVTEEDAPILLSRELFSKTGTIVDFDKMSPIIDRADIIHLHWVAGMLDYKKAPNYLRDKPVVWTLADMNAFTGGCHYSEGCEGFKRECHACPLLGGSDLAHEHWKTKKRAYDALENLNIICPSQWLADRASESSLFRGRPIHVIPNALPVDRFRPTNKLIARHKLGLPLDKKLVIFGAANQKNARKGGDILAASIELLVASGRADNVEGVFFGSSALEIGIKGHNMGHVTNEEKLSLLYAAADAYAFPSREDNAPLTVAEALLSGTPVVAFPVGNVPELVQHKQTGYIAHYEDAADFAEGLAWVLAQPRSTGALARSIRCRTAASAHNDPDRAARTHIELYRSIKQ